MHDCLTMAKEIRYFGVLLIDVIGFNFQWKGGLLENDDWQVNSAMPYANKKA